MALNTTTNGGIIIFDTKIFWFDPYIKNISLSHNLYQTDRNTREGIVRNDRTRNPLAQPNHNT
jgi:hypothetical protein